MRISRRGLLAGAAALGVAPPALAKEQYSYPFELTRNYPWTAISIDKHGALPFLVDSMGAQLVIDQKAAEGMGLKTTTTIDVVTPLGRARLPLYQIAKLQIAGGLDRSIPGILGAPHRPGDFTKGRIGAWFDKAAGFNFDERRITVYDDLKDETTGYVSLACEKPRRVTFAGSTREQFSPTITVDLDGRPTKLTVSTGMPGSLYLHPNYVRANNLANAYAGGIDDVMQGLSGDIKLRKVKGTRLRLGKFVFANPIIDLGDMPEGAGGPAPEDGYIGVELLRRFNFIIDPIRHEIWLKPSKMLGDLYRYDRAGAGFALTDGAYKVTTVAANGPAEKAGLMVGDKVAGWRGDGGIDGLLWALQGAPGAKVSVQVARASGESKLIEIVLEERL